jgi:hypothetical protein
LETTCSHDAYVIPSASEESSSAKGHVLREADDTQLYDELTAAMQDSSLALGMTGSVVWVE